jgi:hypothetical protein
MNNSIEINLELINKKDNYLLLKNMNAASELFIFRKKNEDVDISSLEEEFIRYHSKVNYENEFYESIAFNDGTNVELIALIFDFVSSKNWKLKDLINEINQMVESAFFKKIKLIHQRGIFAELQMILLKNLDVNIEKNSIYDLKDSVNDFEVKSFSKVKKNIIVNYQQLTNNPNAIILAVEVFETNNGENILDLFHKLPLDKTFRYLWIKYCDIDSLAKFQSGEIKEIIVSDLAKGLRLPEKCRNATFEYDIN